ncbi:glycosyltransferase [Bacillus thuringiensis serovar pingluonsis]|uniref:Glycosyltransferase n=1 Tax=Bacillus thuringiensis serovar pingluonsis TaxID=180881 RepID=A0A243B8N6_BACTU|nr:MULTISPECIES: glycosyltransferase family 4 protein [Bacillus cereus group]MEB9680711.1 glycosyltransferase family 4 protein [Bacillus anthracis]OTY40811.1 glycosyltransferase [Bacillus thuringiensis serovar pingluonsis]
MKVLHMNAGAEEGGGKTHIISLLSQFSKEEVELMVFEEGAIAREARNLGIQVHVFTQSSRYDLSILSKIKAFINENQFDIVHTHGARANFYLSLLKKGIKAKWIMTVHSDPTLDFMKRGLKGWVFTKLNLRSFRKVDLFFAITENFKRNIIKLGVPEEKICTVYNGIEYNSNPAKPYDKSEFGIDEGIFTAIQVARLHPVKGHDILFEALQKIKIPNIKVLLLGDGPIEAELKEMVKQKGLEDKVMFLGFRTDSKELYASAHINLLTSYSESFPLVLLEAANQRLTSIATNVGDMKKLIVDDTYGWIVPIGDADSLANALENAYEKWLNGELEAMGNRLYTHASTHFSLKNLYEDTYNAYKTLLLK